MILVTGATGNVGSEIVKQLSYDAVPVRALVRNPARAEALSGPGVEIVTGDLSQPASLAPALEGVSKLVLISSPAENQVQLQSAMIQAAKKAGVRHIVKLSAYGAADDSKLLLGRWHAQSEREIEATGIPYTHLQPNAFMQNFLQNVSTIQSEGVIYAPMGDGKVSFVDVRDIATVALRALTERGHENKTYVITGAEALSHQEVAEKLSKLVGKPIRYVDVPPEAAGEGMKAAGLPGWLVSALLELYAVWKEGHGAITTAVVSDVARKQPFTFDEFARDLAPVLRGDVTARV